MRGRPALDRSVLANIDPAKLGPDSPLLPQVIKAERSRRPSRDLEHLMQVRLLGWVREQERKNPSLAFLFAVPNGGARGWKAAKRLKAEGVRPGPPDLWFPVRRGRYVGLALELKVKPNKPTTEQKIWLQELSKQGWLTDVCYSFEEGRDLILAYLSGKDPCVSY